MPKVLRIINRLNLGGPTYNAAYLSKYMAPEYETLLVAGMHDSTEASSEFIAKEMGLEPLYLVNMYRSIHPIKDIKTYKQLKQIIQEFKPDIVHTHAAKAGAVGRLAAADCDVPVILHTFHGHVFHSYFNPLKTRLFIEIERYLAKKSTKLIAISNLQKSELSQKYKIAPPDKFEVIPLGFDLARFKTNMAEKRAKFRKEHKIAENEIAIGIIGRLVPIKEHRLFIKAINNVLSRKSNIRAFIVGDGEEKENLVKYAHDLGLKYSKSPAQIAPLTFTSWIKEVDYVNAGMDIVALTSNNEGTPVSLIEAQAAHKPIVSTNVGGISDVVIENKTALLSPPGDVEAFTNNLLEMVLNSHLRNEFSLNASIYAKEKFEYTTLVNNMKILYQRLLGNS